MVDSLGEDSVYDRVDVVLVVARSVVGVLLDLVLLLHLVPAGSSVGGEDLNGARCKQISLLCSFVTEHKWNNKWKSIIDKLSRAVN